MATNHHDTGYKNNHGQAQLKIGRQRMNSRRRQDSSLLVQSD